MIRSTLSTLMNTTMGRVLPAHLDKASLDGVGGAQLPPQVPWKLEKRQQFGQIPLQALHQLGILRSPAKPKSLERSSGGGLAGRPDRCVGRPASPRRGRARRTASHRLRILCTQQRWCRARGYTAGIAAARPGQPSVITNCNRRPRNPRRYRSFSNPSHPAWLSLLARTNASS